MKAEVKSMVLGMIGTNCYLLANRDTKEMIVIDPAASPERISMAAEKYGYHPVAILLTHGHFDHIEAMDQLKDFWNVPVYASEKEEEVLKNPRYNLSSMMGSSLSTKADVWVKDHEVLKLAGFDIHVLLTPGHTTGSVCYYLPEEKLLFSGDTLFQGSCGRTDFPGGSMAQIVRSIKERLFVLPDDTRVLPGHEGETYIGMEKEYNMIAGF